MRLTLSSIEQCERLSIGTQRLIARANKQHKAAHSSRKPKRASQYDESLSESRRNIDGVYYTPERVVQDMLERITKGDDLSERTLIDPCCGSGNFLIVAIEMGFRPENIYGYEIDSYSAKIARQRIFELTGYRTRNIICGDFLQVATTTRRRYDYCVTNPPWGRKMSLEVRRERAKRYSMGGSADSSSIFLIASLSILKEGGRLSFLLPESLLTVRAHSDVRRYILDYEADSIIDYGRIFPSLLTSAVAISLRKSAAQQASQILCQTNGASYLRSRESFLRNPMQVLNIWTTPQEAEVIEALFARDHITLKGGGRWGIGVVTGNNKEYLLSEPHEGYREVVKGVDIIPVTKDGAAKATIKRGRQYLKSDLTKYQQVAAADLYDSPEKLIYRFVCDRLCFAVDRESLLTLNSANILVLNSNFPIPADELAKLLNSDLMRWLFSSLFHTRKVLRGDLESLPIFPDYFASCEEFEAERYLQWLGIDERFRDILR